MLPVLGIDVGKLECHAALLEGDHVARKSFANIPKGFDQLTAWLDNRHITKVHACMEATGGYSESLALHLFDVGHTVSVVNPRRVKAFGQSELSRTKTDRVDAALIARFCVAHQPAPWSPPPEELRRLQGLLRRLETLEQLHDQEGNRLEAPMLTQDVRNSINSLMATIERQVQEIEQQIRDLFRDHPDLREKRDLLVTIPGIGEKTAARILAELPDVAELHDSRAAVAYAGLCPAQFQSGKGSRPSRLSKVGNARLRGYLYMPALVAMKHNAALRAMWNRLLERGKPKMVIVGALMRKLLALAFAILRSKQPYCVALSAAH